ncbi:FecR domain-containing protein [Breoghania sp. L-A4]|uniref:FecR family protein n=1 Tax=Breoghania sp. L-A4 TaxID=2304600 RepID=UPI0020C0A4BA|nr:FecR domain-containing protein [Breoghania sp. L-A4]
MIRPALSVSTRVTALGAAFDIRRGDEETEITVAHNAVLVEIDDPKHTQLRLNEAERVGYSSADNLSEVTAKDAATALAWRRGPLVLDNAPLSYVIEEIERHFGGQVVIAGRRLSDRRTSGTIATSDTFAALAFLEHALDLTVTKIGPLVLLRN